MTRPQLLDTLWIAGVRRALLRHFDVHARALPWRRTRDPYAILISEVMLQQTRVTAVVPYFENWVRRFPDVGTLANAPLDDVLHAWQGLGYYARARNLHAAARIIRERHNGTVPADYATLRTLPGIGDYTAGAVASIAYGVRRPAIDGNVRRVFARLFNDADPPPARLRAFAEALLPDDRPGDVNQALMEVGATICTPRSPACDSCPLQQFCAARAAGTQHIRPRRRPAAAVPSFTLATAIIRAPDATVLLVRRPATGLLARMWCLPAREVSASDDGRAAVLDIVRSFVGNAIAGHPAQLGCVDHTFSHRHERYVCWVVNVREKTTGTYANTAWAGPDASAYALPVGQRRILGLLKK